MEPIKVNFKDCNREFLEKTFDLVQLDEIDLLSKWIENSKEYSIDEYENRTLNQLQSALKYRVDDWNELELIENFISPIFALVNFNTLEYGLFSERFIKAIVGEYELSGNPDAVVAKGRRSPKIPYFCFNEYKKEQESKGEPKGQCLAAMLVAQELNNKQRPIYGVVVKGLMWNFMILQSKEYAISKPYQAIDEDIYIIAKLLKHLKTIIEEYVKM
jgi:hypothetical protein